MRASQPQRRSRTRRGPKEYEFSKSASAVGVGCPSAITDGFARGGFTFAELLLVLTLLLIVSGLVFSPVLRLMADQPLKEAAERARVQLASVRLKALDSSSAWQFRFEPGGRRYLWMPSELVTSSPSSASTSNANTANTTTTVSGGVMSGELPNGITFAADLNGSPLSVERLPQQLLSGLPNAYQLAQVGWSVPLTFHPDGSAADFEFSVVDARSRQIRLKVRGFTGGVTVGPIETRRL